MNILSLFDGISCGQIALERAGFEVDNYFASEIDKNAIKVTQFHYPNTVQLGDVQNWKMWKLPKIDLLLAGSPCQGFSFAGKQLNFNDPHSKLFFVFVDILNYLKNKNPNIKFLLENVKMKKEYQKVISDFVNRQPICIDSKLVSYQKRKRLYWANWFFDEPKDKNISFQDYKEYHENECKIYQVPKTKSRIRMWSNGFGQNNQSSCENITHSQKINCITNKQDRCLNAGLVKYKDFCRYLTRKELELGQTLPVNYTQQLSYNQACKAIGNGWTVDVIVHILNCMKKEPLF